MTTSSTRRTPLLAAAAVLLAAVASVALVGAPIANAHPSPARPAVTGPQLPHQIVAYRGAGKAMFANADGSTTFKNLGGKLLAAPTVAYAGGHYYFVADIKHKGLEVRTAAKPWAPLVKGKFECASPDLTSNGKKLGLGCLVGDKLYTARFAAPAHGLPQLKSLTNQGGKYADGPAAWFLGSTLYFAVNGKPYVKDLLDENTYRVTYGAPKTTAPRRTSLFDCDGQPAATSAPSPGTVYFGCATSDGSDDQLSVITGSTNGSQCGVQTTSDVIDPNHIGVGPTTTQNAVVVVRTTSGDIEEGTIGCISIPSDLTVIATGATTGPSIAVGPGGYR